MSVCVHKLVLASFLSHLRHLGKKKLKSIQQTYQLSIGRENYTATNRSMFFPCIYSTGW